MRRLENLVGQPIDDFIVQERIGKGGMATVFRAHQPSVNRDIALKVIELDDTRHDEDDFPRRFQHEAALIARLEHPHIVPMYDYGIEDNLAFLAMRLLKGGSLSDLLADGPLALERTVELFGQIARGLAFAHSKGVIHRDLKPSNILMDEEGNAMLTDFGLAKLITGGSDITKTGNIVGTPSYMSPEQLRGETLDHRSDIYSLGVILYQMLTGRPPFEGSSSDVISIIYKHLEKTPELPSKVNPHITPAIDHVVMKALAKKPDSRYDSAGEMYTALRHAVGMRPSTGSFPVPTVPRVTQEVGRATSLLERSVLRTRRRRMTAVGAALLLILVVAGVVAALIFATSRDETVLLTPPTVLPNRRVNASQIVPSPLEIDRAQLRLGTDGFVALIACNRTSQYHAGIVREMVDLATGYGIRIEIYDPDNNAGRQIPLIEQARADGADGMIICPLDLALLDSTLQDLDEIDMPLVFYSGDEDHYGGVVMRGDSYTLGYIPGIYGGRLIRNELDGQANVVILDYPDLPDIVRRADGLEAGVLELAPEANIIGRYRGGTEEDGYNSIRRLIEDGVAFNFIASINDDGSYGAIRAMEEAGFEPDSVMIVSVDAEAQAVQYIQEGYFMRGSVSVARTQTAQGMVYSMVKLLAGSTVPEDVLTLTGEGDMVTRESLARQDGE
ncbi:MAG: protein kinase [bacterium]|nr:protein kinase [bacterium]